MLLVPIYFIHIMAKGLNQTIVGHNDYGICKITSPVSNIDSETPSSVR
jgi:hypothetical protein